MTEKKPQRGPTVRTARARARAMETFIKRLAETCNVAEASRVAGIARSTAHDWRAADADFCKLWDEAIEMARDALEAEARRRAVDGWQEPVFQQGKQVGTIQRYSDRMLEILLKGHRPQFRDRGPDVNVGVLVSERDRDSRAARIEAARKIAFVLAEANEELNAKQPPAVLRALPAPDEPPMKDVNEPPKPPPAPEPSELPSLRDARRDELGIDEHTRPVVVRKKR